MNPSLRQIRQHDTRQAKLADEWKASTEGESESARTIRLFHGAMSNRLGNNLGDHLVDLYMDELLKLTTAIIAHGKEGPAPGLCWLTLLRQQAIHPPLPPITFW